MSPDLPPRPLPLVGVTPTEKLGAVSRLSADEAQAAGGLLHVLRLDEALEKHWDTDAFVVPYQLVGFGDLRAGWPRFRTNAISDVRAHGADIVASMIVLDWDLPKITVNGQKVKQPWTAELLDAFLEQFDKAIEEDFALASDWTAFYTTNHGARLIYVLDNPLPVEQYKPYCKGMIAAFLKHGIKFDILADWTHLFRLPFVVDPRYGKATEPRVFEIRAENRLRVASLTPVGPNEQVGPAIDVTVEHGDRPSEADVQQFLTPSFLKLAKHWLKGHSCFSCLFEHTKVAIAGNRNTTLASYVGDAINQLFPRSNVTKAHIYALFYETVSTTLEPDADTPDWLIPLWDMTERFWAQQQAQAAAHAEYLQDLGLSIEEKKYQILQGMREWCTDPRLHSADEAEALDFLSHHLVASIGQFAYVMTLNGRYDHTPCGEKQLAARARELGMDDFIVTETVDNAGRPKTLGLSKILKTNGTIVAALRARIGDDGGWISDIETEDAALNIRTYARRLDLEPTYNADVDEWLHRLAGNQYEKFTRWIGCSLAFDKGAICALAVIGPQGCGKKMLVTGLAEAITTQRFVDASEVFESFNAGLLESPFVVVDEAWPAGVNPADTFRRLTAGNTNVIKRKFLSHTTLVAPLRVILTANNSDIILDLAGKRDLTQRDQEALEIRLFPIDVPEDVKTWLREKGGHEFTAGWIRGDGGQPSQFVLARHFLWLYEKHKNYSEPRLLVEGKLPIETSVSLRTHGSAVAPVIETLLGILEGLGQGKTFVGAACEEERVYVTSSEVLKQYRLTVGRVSRTELTIKKVSASLSAINCRQTVIRALKSRPEVGKQRWQELDLPLLHQVAQRDGRSVAYLARLVEGAPVIDIAAALPPIPTKAKARGKGAS